MTKFIIIGISKHSHSFDKDARRKLYWTGKTWSELSSHAKKYKSRKIGEAALARMLKADRWDEKQLNCSVEEVLD